MENVDRIDARLKQLEEIPSSTNHFTFLFFQNLPIICDKKLDILEKSTYLCRHHLEACYLDFHAELTK